jgi:hypothetical protein
MADSGSIREQLRRNAVALTSLVVAVTSLGYVAWRNELTERNRNVRAAGFEILMQLGELQVLADQAHYAGDRERGDPIVGWGRVLMARDLADFMGPEVKRSTEALHARWTEDWDALGEEPGAGERITAAIEATRGAVRAELDALD